MKKDIIAHIQSLGCAVYMRNAGDMWLLYERDGRIGKFENGFSGPCIVTVHKPNTDTGTGFKMCDTTETPTEDELELGFALAPAWAYRSQIERVEKYRGIEDFRKASAWNGAYRLVKEGEGE